MRFIPSASHMGFEALLLQKTVHCFGVPWYAGWGVTDDSHAPKNGYQLLKIAVVNLEKKTVCQKSRSMSYFMLVTCNTLTMPTLPRENLATLNKQSTG